MKTTLANRALRSLALGLAASVLLVTGAVQAQDNIAHFGTISRFTGGDPGEGLDFEGIFQYAVNVGGVGGIQIGDALFTNDSAPGITISSDFIANPWEQAPALGDSPNDDGLELVLHSIRWSNGGGGPRHTVDVELADIVQGANYKLQLLFQERCCNRAFDILIDDNLAVTEMFPPAIQGTPQNPNQDSSSEGAVYTYQFTAQSNTLKIVLDGRNTAHQDSNAILNDLTLEIQLDKRGDFNFDGAVNLDDFQIMLNNMLVGNNYAQGDINFSRRVDLRDFVEFKLEYHAQNPPAVVPEPAASLLAGIALLGLVVAARTKSARWR